MKWWVGLHSGAMLYEKYVSLNTKHSAEWEAHSLGNTRELTPRGEEQIGSVSGGLRPYVSVERVASHLHYLFSSLLLCFSLRCWAPGVRFAQIKCMWGLHWTSLKFSHLVSLSHWPRIRKLHIYSWTYLCGFLCQRASVLPISAALITAAIVRWNFF